MKHDHSSIKALMASMIVFCIAAFSCHNNDTTEESASNSTDTVTTMNVDTSNMMADTNSRMMADTMMNKPDNTMVKDKGMAKPNPAKKGMKGKVSVSGAPAKMNRGSMEADNSGVYSNVEVIPSFPGGNQGLQKFFDDNLEYPVDATNDGVEGTVNVSFVVDETGRLTAPQVTGDNLGYGLEAEALRVINKMPTWNPGKLKGKNVKTRFTLPVKFVLY